MCSYPEYNCEANQVSVSPVDRCGCEGQNTVIELDQESVPLLMSQCETETTIQPNSFTSDDNKFKSKIDMCNLKEWCDSISYEGGFFYCFPMATIGVRYYNLCGCNTDSSDQCGDLSHLSFSKILASHNIISLEYV